MYQHLKRPSQLSAGTQLNLFIEGIKPMWEVPEHKTGGVWNLRVNKGYANKLWEDLILGLIGEQFSHANEVTGIVLSTTE
jgi:translation initiation factor 4E